MTDALKLERVLPEWEGVGTVLDAARYAGIVSQIFDHLESGNIGARSKSDPPTAGHESNEILNQAGTPTPSWWRSYREFYDLQRPHQVWMNWFRSEVEIDHEKVLNVFENNFRTAREKFKNYSNKIDASEVWSLREALGWLASDGDNDLINTLRDFSNSLPTHQLEIQAGKNGIQYLRFQIASRYCRCNSTRPLLSQQSEDGCQCLRRVWTYFITNLKIESFEIRFFDESGSSRLVSPLDMASAKPDFDAGKVSIGGKPGEFRFLRTALQSAEKSWGKPLLFNDDEIKKWISQHPQYTNVKQARSQFIKNPRAKGLSETFEKIWQSEHKRPRGRPRKQLKKL